jgi:hypothetical protein
MPAGLSLEPDDGDIAGIPANSGDFQFTVQVLDAAGTAVQADLSLTIIEVPDIDGPDVDVPALWLDAQPAIVSTNGHVTLRWRVAEDRSQRDDRIGLYRAFSPVDTPIATFPTNGRPSGSWTTPAPDATGHYEFRYLSSRQGSGQSSIRGLREPTVVAVSNRVQVVAP